MCNPACILDFSEISNVLFRCVSQEVKNPLIQVGITLSIFISILSLLKCLIIQMRKIISQFLRKEKKLLKSKGGWKRCTNNYLN